MKWTFQSSFLVAALVSSSSQFWGTVVADGDGCHWTIYQNRYSNLYAGGVSQVFTTLAEAQAKCLELGTSVCRAVTCGNDANFGTNGCTVRASAQLGTSSTGETSYVPSADCTATDIECGEFQVVCDANLQAFVNCVLGFCVNCTPEVQKEVNCVINPFTLGRPDDFTLINELAFPNWCLEGGSGGDAEDRVSCNDAAKGEANGTINPKLFNPIYLTKKHSGAAPEKGGYPTNTDIQYVYEFAGPFLGQPGGGSADQCPEDFDGTRNNYKQCGKLNTLHDDGPYGPGHVPPHIATAAIKFALAGEGNGVSALMGPAVPDESWFDFPTNGCRIKKSILFNCLRTFYPRVKGEVVKYPPPFTVEGGDYKLEFVNKVGDSCADEKEKFPTAICFEEHSGGGPGDYPDYIKQGGGPHYCSKIAVEAEANDGWCPYLFFGPKRGQYRHPHIAYAALETYIAHQVLPDQCGTAWDDSRYPAAVDTTVAWPFETEVDILTNNHADFEPNTLFSPNQPKTVRRRVGKSSKGQQGKLTFVWPDDNGFQKKPVIGQFANNMFVGAAE